MNSSKPASPNADVIAKLLSQADWVRGLAHTLVSDPGSAEDLAQDALVAAVEAPPARLVDARAWLGAVLRNLARRRHRSDSRRAQRETRAARPEAIPSTAALVERASLQSDLVARVVNLDPLYREVLLLHFFEGLPTARIATQLSMPVNTVRTRIERGLAQLRQALDSEYGDRSAWSLVLAPLLIAPVGLPIAPLAEATTSALRHGLPTALKTGVLLVQTKFILTITAAVVALLIALQIWAGTGDAPLAPSADPALSDSSLVSLNSQINEPIERTPELINERGVRTEVPPASLPTGLPPRVLRGRIVDEYGEPLAGLPVAFYDIDYQSAERFVSQVREAQAMRASLPQSTLAELVEFETDPKAALLKHEDSEAIRYWALRMLTDPNSAPAARSDSDGAFVLQLPNDAPDPAPLAGNTAPVRLAACDFQQIDMGFSKGLQSADPELIIVAVPIVSLAGWVQTEDGTPLPMATLSTSFGVQRLRHFPLNFTTLGQPFGHQHKVDAEGHFELEQLAYFDGMQLLVGSSGFRSKSVSIPAYGDAAMTVVLEQRPVATRLTGVVLDRLGAPVAGAVVSYVYDETRTDEAGRFAIDLQALIDPDTMLAATKPTHQPATLSGAELLDMGAGEIELRLGAPSLSITGQLALPKDSILEDWRLSLLDPTTAGWNSRSLEERSAEIVDTDTGFSFTPALATDGTFAIKGLMDRPYTLMVANLKTAQTYTHTPIAAGSQGVLLSVPELDHLIRFAGRIEDSAGIPMQGVSVHLSRKVPFTEGRFATSNFRSTKTDSNGAFLFEGLGTKDLQLNVNGKGIESVRYPTIPDLFFTEPCVLQVSYTCRIHVELAPGDAADSFGILDANGEQLIVYEIHTSGRNIHYYVPRRDGSFQPCEVSELAAELVLYRDKVELRRTQIALRHGALQKLEL